MSKSKNNSNANNGNIGGVMGPSGPIASMKTTIGMNNARIASGRPSILLPEFQLPGLVSALQTASYTAGRHRFGVQTAVAAQPWDFIPNEQRKEANYVVTNTLPHGIASNTTTTVKVSNGRVRYEMCIPYYDGEAYNTLDTSETVGAIAPIGSFKVGIDVHGGGVLTGTDSNGALELDKILLAALGDLFSALSHNVTENKPVFAAAGYAIAPPVSVL